MSLDLYMNDAYPDGDPVSKNGTFTSPLQVVLAAGATSSAIPLWIATGDTQFYYTMTGAQGVTPVDVDGSNESDWIFLSDDGVTFGGAGAGLTNLGTIGPGGDEADQIPIWAKFAVPVGEDAQVKTDLRLRLDYTKHAVSS